MSALDATHTTVSPEDTSNTEPSTGSSACGATAEPASGAFDETVRTLAPLQLLVEAGQPRTRVFRLETGAVCSFRQLQDGRREVVDFAVAGDIVGLGSQDRHVWSAEAVAETRITCLPLSAQDGLVARDPAVRARLTRAIDRELVILRSELVEAGSGAPLIRVASYLLAVSGINASEGRHPEFIGDDMKCGATAEMLGFEIDELASHLVELARRSLLAFCPPHGLRLTDIPALERLAEGG